MLFAPMVSNLKTQFHIMMKKTLLALFLSSTSTIFAQNSELNNSNVETEPEYVLRHSMSITGGFAYTGSGDMYGTAVEGAYSYYFDKWSVTGQIGRADFSRVGNGTVAEPGLGIVDYVPADVFTAYRTADLLIGYTLPLAEHRLHFIARGGFSLARIGTYYIDPAWQNEDFDVLDMGALAEVGLGYTIINTCTATIDVNIKAQGRNYFNTNDGYVRLSTGITCRLYYQ